MRRKPNAGAGTQGYMQLNPNRAEAADATGGGYATLNLTQAADATGGGYATLNLARDGQDQNGEFVRLSLYTCGSIKYLNSCPFGVRTRSSVQRAGPDKRKQQVCFGLVVSRLC